MEGLELISFQIISAVGTARSCYIEAIAAAREGDYEKAQKLISQGEEFFNQGHHCHASLIQTARPKVENILVTFENIFKELIQ